MRKPRVLRAKQRADAAIDSIKSDAATSPHPAPQSAKMEPAEDSKSQTSNPVANEVQNATALVSPAPKPLPTAHVYPTPARRARTRGRHWFLALSFLLICAAPIAAAAYYLWTHAADQYASNLAFSVRSEEQGSAVELLGGVTELSGSSSADTDILYAYLTSQELVSKVNARLDLSAIWSRVPVSADPVFAYDPAGTIEDLLAHWQRKISIIYDSGTRLIDVRVLAFDPGDAQAVAQAVMEESTAMINALSDIARDDAIKYARDELAVASIRLKEARQNLTRFRNRTQIVDPSIDTQNQMGVLVTLQRQLADALIEFDLLQDTTRAGDPRISQATRRVDVIQKRIDAERRKLGLGTGAQEGVVFADLVGEYEGLIVDREFAEAAYTSALATHDAALAEARRQSRYLAAHIRPTLAQQAEYPERIKTLLIVALFSFLAWTILSLVYYSLRDRS
ncbi:capsule biosynthesis protein [uncultured Tateyamaria sp.]|uniref:capsule biosynthesis protein n=1 Tax=uncultured Tateyamaria sp. TaxID=455651 RepID=UPI00260BC28D|nr:capsule biosynthesis protein [uncultured Tateyamaria sp.]